GYFAHGLWDLAHHPRGVPTQVPNWYRLSCIVYDWLVGAFIAVAYGLASWQERRRSWTVRRAGRGGGEGGPGVAGRGAPPRGGRCAGGPRPGGGGGGKRDPPLSLSGGRKGLR